MKKIKPNILVIGTKADLEIILDWFKIKSLGICRTGRTSNIVRIKIKDVKGWQFFRKYRIKKCKEYIEVRKPLGTEIILLTEKIY